MAANHETYQEKKRAVPVGGQHLGLLLLFADSCWILAMARVWNGLLEQAGLRFAWPEPLGAALLPIHWRWSLDAHGHMVSRPSGVWITFDGHFAKELAERKEGAWRFFDRRGICCVMTEKLSNICVFSSCIVASLQ